jgi:beta-phosphoglucomutase
MIGAVIFDFDGIIVDSETIHYRAFQSVLEPLGLGFSWQEYLETYIGFDDRDAFRAAFDQAGKDLSPARLAELITEKTKHFLAVVEDGIEPYPGVVELIEGLSIHVPVALCSGALRCDIDPVLADLGLSDHFSAMVTAEEVKTSKPHPASYELALKRLQEAFPEKALLPGTVLAIEDTPAGISSARGAGLPVLAVSNSFPEATLEGAARVVSSLEGLSLADLESCL